MRNDRWRIWGVPAAVAGGVVLLDQLSKAWVVNTLGPIPLTQFIPVLGDQVRIAYAHNTGIAFSMLQGHPELLTGLAIVIITGALIFYATQLPNHRPIVQLIMGLIVGGGLGNLIDRIRLGYVVDFISVGWFPIFNLADSALTVGATLLILLFLREELLAQPADDDQPSQTPVRPQ
ncbi:MAG: signal peptidase II [Oscillochloridaceae bacterium umkhey_bin13]